MKSRRAFALLPLLLLIAAVTFRISGDHDLWLDLAPVPYEMKVPADIAQRLEVENQSADMDDQFLQQAYTDGAISIIRVSYQPAVGEKTWFMAAYYFNEADLDKTIVPDEVPQYGFKLITNKGMALSVSGPQDSIYEPTSQDGKNISKLYDILYNADSYRAKP